MGTRGHNKPQQKVERNFAEMQRELFGAIAQGKPLTGREDIIEVIEKGHPAFGGKLFRQA